MAACCEQTSLMKTRAGNQYKHPSISTIRREVKQIINAALFCLYQPLQNAFNDRESVREIAKNSHNVLAFQ
ncbi:phage antitermination protein Q [Klebsiella pneumoniae]|nr:phage antitermination protein Q [Klebsiella pneumoniae]